MEAGNWLGIIIAVGIVVLAIRFIVVRLKAAKKVEKEMLYGGVEQLIHALKNVDIEEDARIEAIVNALGKTKDPRAIEALIAFVNSPVAREIEEPEPITTALNALAETEDPKVVDLFIAGLSDKDWKFRYFVCTSMLMTEKIRDLRAVEPLIALLKEIKDMKRRKDPRYDSESEVVVEQVLKMITGKGFGTDPEKWERWWEENKTDKDLIGLVE